ncbi:MAG: amino acid ABC transporter permease [Oscillospiraceae bacterium]|nr:amino acid ABC transporter permease [Eubacteriales bacterium]MDY2617303.1 amino acid ABC transporter permease [Oscillospiraceae bacterium]
MSGIIAATGFADSAFAQNFYKSFLANGRWELYVSGLGRTLEVTVLALLLGVILGVITALLRVAHDQRRPGRHSVGSVLLSICNAITRIYITVIRGTPAIVQLMILGFVVFKSSRNFTLVGALGLGINSGAYVSEIIRSGLMSIDKGQMEAGRSLGLNYMTTMVNVIIPQAIKNILPALGNEFITLLKDTSLISVIAGKELLYAAKAISAKTYDYMFPLLGVSVVYLVMVIIFTWLLGILERRLRASDRR